MTVESPPQTGERLQVDYVPRPGLLKLCLINFVLGLLTLTLYRFWAKTNVRRHIWSSVHINGHPLEYTGRGMELFKGAMIVFLVFGLPVVLLISILSIAYGPEHPAISGIQGLLFLLVALLWGAAVYRARRYQLSRTLWRGIRGALVGSATTYSLLYFGSMLARAFSLGWSTPVMNLNLQQQMISDMRFGDQAFRFKGRAGPLYPSYAISWFLTLFVVVVLLVVAGIEIGALFGDDLAAALDKLFNEQGEPTEEQSTSIGLFFLSLIAFYLVYVFLSPLVWSIYLARELTLFTAYTQFGDASFRMKASAWSLFGLTIGNLLIALLTLGIGAPFIQQRLVRYVCDRIEVDGLVDIDRIRQSQAPLDTAGEGLADAFDVGGL